MLLNPEMRQAFAAAPTSACSSLTERAVRRVGLCASAISLSTAGAVSIYDVRVANMPLLAGFIILLSGYLSFAARREGASLVRGSGLAVLSAAVLQAFVTGGTVWLSGIALHTRRTGSGDLGSGLHGQPFGSPRSRPLPGP